MVPCCGTSKLKASPLGIGNRTDRWVRTVEGEKRVIEQTFAFSLFVAAPIHNGELDTYNVIRISRHIKRVISNADLIVAKLPDHELRFQCQINRSTDAWGLAWFLTDPRGKYRIFTASSVKLVGRSPDLYPFSGACP